MDNALQTPSPPATASPDQTGRELKRGAFLNTIAMVAANFRAVFTILIARLLGRVELGIFSVAWALVDLCSKIGIIGMDDGVATLVARANASNDRARCRALFHTAATITVLQSALVAALLMLGFRAFGSRVGLPAEMVPALSIIVLALPGIALYRISNSVSRGMKVMAHDIYSRGLTESGVTTLAFLIALGLGARLFAPEIAAIAGTAASGMVAFVLAARQLRRLPNEPANKPPVARELVAYSLPIGADQFLNAFIWRIDVILLGWFVGRVPGVTLTTLGIYGAVVGVANGLRKVSQAFTPIFAPVVAGMTATGEHKQAMATYAQLARWMLWILLPFVAVLALAGNTILLVFGQKFQGGSDWLTIVALACATNAFINLGETVIMVQRPGLNFLNSLITCVVGTAVTFGLILNFGVMGAAFGILITYLVQGIVRNIMLRVVFHWHNPWNNIAWPIYAAAISAVPALALRWFVHGIAGEMSAAVLFLLPFGLLWQRHRAAFRLTTT